jgi:NNP family nitrate/nitrite transporter-like MFS transporter
LIKIKVRRRLSAHSHKEDQGYPRLSQVEFRAMSKHPQTGGSQPQVAYQLSGNPTIGLAMGTWGFFIGFAAVALYGPAATYFQEQMQLGGFELGLLVAAPQLTGSLLRIPFGAWVDRVGGRLPMLTLFGLSLVGMWGLVFILISVENITFTAYPLIVMLGFLSGCGVASFSVGIPQVSYWYPQSRQGTVLGAYGGIGNLAPGIFTLLLPFAIAAWGLAGSYFAWFTFLLIGAGIYAWLARDAYIFQLRAQGIDPETSREIAREKGQELFPSQAVWQAVITAAEDTRTWGLVALYFVSFGGFLALTAWFPSYWVNFHGVDVETAGVLGGLGFSLLAAVIRVFGGMLSERIGGERTAVLSFAGVLAGALILTYVTDFYQALAGELLIALGMGVGNAAVFKMVPKYVPEAVGGAAGLVGGLGATGGFIIPPFLGAVVDAIGAQGYAGITATASTALHLQKLGANVMLVDKYGPANSRATSGGETRGVSVVFGKPPTWFVISGGAFFESKGSFGCRQDRAAIEGTNCLRGVHAAITGSDSGAHHAHL